MAVNRQYAKEMHDQFGYLSTWLPTAPVSLGDVGVLRDGILEKVGTLKDFGITYAEQVDKDEGDLEHTSSGAVSIELKAAGGAPVTSTVPGKFDGDIRVSFNRANAVLFQASRCKMSTMADIKQVTDAILSQYHAGTWPKENVVVTAVVRSAATTVLISSGTNAYVNLQAKGELGQGKAQLASASAKIEAGSRSQIGTTIVATKGATPLFQARGIKTSLLPWRDPSLMTRALDVQLVSLTHHDLIGSSSGERAD
jgi:hypothetical protein